MEPTASQSQDCEPTPPVQRHGSKSNFFMGGGDGPGPGAGHGGGHGGGDSPRHPLQLRGGGYPVRGSPHGRSHAASHGSRTPDPLSPCMAGPSPTMQQRVKAIGVATPLAMNSPVRR